MLLNAKVQTTKMPGCWPTRQHVRRNESL